MMDGNDQPAPAFWTSQPGPRLPRIALMGEFSAGKSTLANLMIGTSPLPVQVVATQLPPVFITYGSEPAVIVDLDGQERPCDMDALDGIDPEAVAFIRFHCEAEILKSCDLIDMPGISDPNMASLVWERLMPLADGVLWCSPATQAWRQSEAAVWESIDEPVQQQSLLVLTRKDMLLSERDRQKVLKRVTSEVSDTFAEVLMISLTRAQAAGDDMTMWEESGADAFAVTFMTMLERTQARLQSVEFVEAAERTIEESRPAGSDADPGQSTLRIAPKRPKLRRPILKESGNKTADATDPSAYMPKFS